MPEVRSEEGKMKKAEAERVRRYLLTPEQKVCYAKARSRPADRLSATENG